MNRLDAVGQLGVLPVGITGAERKFTLVRRRGLTAAQVSVAGLRLPSGLGIVTGLLLPRTFVPAGAEACSFALFRGVAMGVSALPVIGETLLDMTLLHRGIGQLFVSAGVVADLAGLLLLSVGPAMVTVGPAEGGIAAFAFDVVIATSGMVDPAKREPMRTMVLAAPAPIFFSHRRPVPGLHRAGPADRPGRGRRGAGDLQGARRVHAGAGARACHHLSLLSRVNRVVTSLMAPAVLRYAMAHAEETAGPLLGKDALTAAPEGALDHGPDAVRTFERRGDT
ncbi:hypothetical protein [Streptomyces sp. KMM 9044]|uniref:hypothetical protein n=1 Tax=Streptomyces sp. KMM 9044 TaxID=2744474 RepID=UPI00215073BF|nr:hypothetical protein [Streptomyces sp. KMM 9044]WAX81696.1 hypothetical protein HUV60_032975 [Streptomyces sp. KMM 9044]